MTLRYVGTALPCVDCGRSTVFADDVTRAPRHVGGLCSPAAAPAPHPGTPPALRADLVPIAGALRGRLEALADLAGGDLEKIARKSVPLVMDLFEHLRTSGRYPLVHHPPYPQVLARQGTRPSPVWLARPKWTNPAPPRGPVVRLDVPGNYLHAFTTWLPVTALTHDTSGTHDRKRSGVYLITPPTWDHPDLPNPIGDREEAGPVWVPDPIVRCLLRAHQKYGLCGPTAIHEAWTAPATEDMLTGLKMVLQHLRSTAYTEGDELLRLMVKDMYSKFVSTIGESKNNHRLKRPEWSFIIQSQAHWNVWERAYKAYQAGMQIIRVSGTDEIRLVGDWRTVWTEGNELPQMKTKE